MITIQMIGMILSFICIPAIAIHSDAMTLVKDIDNAKLIHSINADKQQVIQEDSGDAEHSFSSSEIPAKFNEFPNLHPLFVHFPIVLLLLAFFTQLTSFFIYREPLSYVTIALLAAGFTGAILAAKVYHPHITEGLPDRMVEIFEIHMKYANITLWLAGIGLALKLLSHFLFRLHIVAELIVAISIAAAAIYVSLTGHLGSQMVYIEGIGPQGNHVEHHEHGQEHHDEH